MDELYKEIFQLSPIPLMLTDQTGAILDVNICCQHLLGYSKQELIHIPIQEIVSDEDSDIPSGNHSFESFVDSCQSAKEFPMLKKKGEVFHAELSATTCTHSSSPMYIWSLRTIDHEKKLIHELRERVKEQLALLRVTETLFKCDDISTALSECIVYIREGWQFPEHTVVRIRLKDGSGYTSEDFIETKWGLASEIRCNGEHYGTVEVFYTAEVPVHGESIFLEEEQKLIDGLSKLFSLFLEQLYAIDKLRENETLIRKITNQIPANTYQFDIDENGDVTIFFASKGISEAVYDYKAEELLHDPTKVTNLIHEDDKERYQECMRNAYRNQSDLSIQFRTLFNNTVRWRWLRATAEKAENGKVIWYGSAQDITPFIDYIEVLEQILSDISHVIRRPVATMLGLTNLVETMSMTEENIRDVAQKLKAVGQEMDEYTRSLNQRYHEKKLSMDPNKTGIPLMHRTC